MPQATSAPTTDSTAPPDNWRFDLDDVGIAIGMLADLASDLADMARDAAYPPPGGRSDLPLFALSALTAELASASDRARNKLSAILQHPEVIGST